MKTKLNKYKCPCCQRIFERRDKRQWIKSDCTATGQTTRLILIKKKNAKNALLVGGK